MLVLAVLMAMTIAAEGDSVGTATLQLEPAKTLSGEAHAYYMSLGPRGPAVSEPTSDAGRRFGWSYYHRLRVTLHNCELSVWLTIDDIKVGNADTKTVVATYVLQRSEISQALGRPMTFGGIGPPSAVQPVIVWVTPTTFEWQISEDTLVVEHVKDAEFQVTVRQRIK